MYKNKVRFYRKKIGMSMSDLAMKANISLGYVSHLEKGSRKNPSREVMQRIADALGKTLVEVFFSKD